MNTALRVEWPTLALAAACYTIWAIGLLILPEYSLVLAVTVTAVAIALHSSLTHEVVHGHPVPDWPWFNHALVFPTLIVAIPFERFRDTHLAHHVDAVLTDPYDDPESNYLDPAVWERLSWPLRTVLSFNNILLGRLLLGPAVSLVAYLIGDLRSSRAGDARVRSAWLWHIPEAGCVVAFVFWAGTMPLWAYLVACYGAMSIVKIRTFLEHQAHDRASGRTAIVEDSGFLSWMFLNNNLHVVHHMHPRVPWYDLPKLYAEHRAHYVRRNGGYVFRSYGDVFARYFLKRKDPVPHPHYPR